MYGCGAAVYVVHEAGAGRYNVNALLGMLVFVFLHGIYNFSLRVPLLNTVWVKAVYFSLERKISMEL